NGKRDAVDDGEPIRSLPREYFALLLSHTRFTQI
ncbi:MAG: hypothetical protein ACI814_005196, partial [Mariniblastus sp.]